MSTSVIYPISAKQMALIKMSAETVKACNDLIMAQGNMLNWLFENIQPGGFPEDFRTTGMELREKITLATKKFEELQAKLNAIPE